MPGVVARQMAGLHNRCAAGTGCVGGVIKLSTADVFFGAPEFPGEAINDTVPTAVAVDSKGRVFIAWVTEFVRRRHEAIIQSASADDFVVKR